MRVYLARSQVHIRAAIRDWLDSIVGMRWSTSAPVDEPGMTTFSFYDDWGDLGSIKIFETESGITTFTDILPSHITVQEILKLIMEGNIFLDIAEMAAIRPFIEVENKKKEMGIDSMELDILFRFAIENPGVPMPSLTKDEMQAAEGVLKRLSDRIESRRRDTHETIVQSTIGDLRIQNVWVVVKKDFESPVEVQLDQLSPIDRKIRKPGRPRLPEDLWALEQLKLGRDPKEVKIEWLWKSDQAGRSLQDPDRQFRDILYMYKGKGKKRKS